MKLLRVSERFFATAQKLRDEMAAGKFLRIPRNQRFPVIGDCRESS
jgi:hypothetical protein